MMMMDTPGRAGRETREKTNPRGRRPPVGTDGNPPEIPTHTPPWGESARRRDADGRAGRGAGGGRRVAGTGRGHPAGNRRAAARRDALPRDTPRLLATPRIQADGRGRGLEGGCGAAAGPPVHTTRGSEAQRRGGRGDP